MKATCWTIALLLTAPAATAGDAHLKKIKKRYYEVKEQVKSETLMRYGLSLQNMVPGIGEQLTRIDFYHAFAQDEDTGKVLLTPPTFVTVAYNVAASMHLSFEYLFDAKGNLLFYFHRTEGHDCIEERFYFHDQKIIKLKVNPAKECTGERPAAVEKTSGFGKYQKQVRAVLENVKQYRALFENLARISR